MVNQVRAGLLGALSACLVALLMEEQHDFGGNKRLRLIVLFLGLVLSAIVLVLLAPKKPSAG